MSSLGRIDELIEIVRDILGGHGMFVLREDDGRWIADAHGMPGVMTYGATREEAVRRCQLLACEVLGNLQDQAGGQA